MREKFIRFCEEAERLALTGQLDDDNELEDLHQAQVDLYSSWRLSVFRDFDVHEFVNSKALKFKKPHEEV